MKQASEFYKQDTVVVAKNKYDSSELSDSDIEIANELMRNLTSAKPAWRTALKTKVDIIRYRDNLVRALIENNAATHTHIIHGLKAARLDSSDFLPAIGKFVKWCKEGYELEQARMPKKPTALICNGTFEERQKIAKSEIAKIKQGLLKCKKNT